MKISDALYYQRRHAEELAALRRAVTPEAADRRSRLVQSYAQKLRDIAAATAPLAPPAPRPVRSWILELE